MISSTPQRGFTLLIAIVLTSVLVSIGLALLDITYKQTLLASTATQSTIAFYAADGAMECALYWDQQQDAFDYASPLSSISCAGQASPVTTSVSGSTRTSSFTSACINNTIASVTITKTSLGVTTLYANGYNSCYASETRRIERGIKVSY